MCSLVDNLCITDATVACEYFFNKTNLYEYESSGEVYDTAIVVGFVVVVVVDVLLSFFWRYVYCTVIQLRCQMFVENRVLSAFRHIWLLFERREKMEQPSLNEMRGICINKVIYSRRNGIATIRLESSYRYPLIVARHSQLIICLYLLAQSISHAIKIFPLGTQSIDHRRKRRNKIWNIHQYMLAYATLIRREITFDSKQEKEAGQFFIRFCVRSFVV